jgi:hypothetical protein
VRAGSQSVEPVLVEVEGGEWEQARRGEEEELRAFVAA